MAGTFKRVKLEVDSVAYYPLEVKYALQRNANQVGRRIGESLTGRAYAWVDAHAVDNISQANQIELWKMATETKDPLHKVSITWYAEDGDKVLMNAEFQGWVSVFQYNNPKISAIPGAPPVYLGGDGAGSTAQIGYNNLLYIELVVVLDETNISKHKFAK
jgi:hypothetical protein